MKSLKFIFILLLIVALTACGRRLPDETPTPAPAVSEAEAADDTADSVASEDPTEAATTPDTLDTDETGETVSAEPDAIVAQIELASAANGETLFNQMTDTGFACANCHYVDSTETQVGPGLYGIANRADERVPGQVAERYIYNSILHPNDYVVDGFAENLMPATYEEIYRTTQIYDLVAYLMTLEDPNYVEQETASDTTDEDTANAEATEDSTDADLEATEDVVVDDEPGTEATEDVDADTDDMAETVETTEEAVADTAEATDDASAEPEVIVVTATPVVIVVTATPSAAETQPTQVADAGPTVDPYAEADIVVTLASVGIPAYGETLYNEALVDGFACSDCHAAESDDVIVGEGMVGVRDRALAQGRTAESYLFDSIMMPEAHSMLEGAYRNELSSSQVYDLVAYIMAQQPEMESAAPVEDESAPADEPANDESAPADEPTEEEPAAEPTAVPVEPQETPAEADTATDDNAASVDDTADAAPEDNIISLVSLGDVANGEALFNQMTDTGFACANCHYIDSLETQVGPGLLNIPSRAATRVEGQVAERYIFNSITHPNDYIVDEFTANLMPQTYSEIFSNKEIYDLVAYLMTLDE